MCHPSPQVLHIRCVFKSGFATVSHNGNQMKCHYRCKRDFSHIHHHQKLHHIHRYQYNFDQFQYKQYSKCIPKYQVRHRKWHERNIHDSVQHIHFFAIEARCSSIASISIAKVAFEFITTIDFIAYGVGITSMESSCTLVNVNTNFSSCISRDWIEGFEYLSSKAS